MILHYLSDSHITVSIILLFRDESSSTRRRRQNHILDIPGVPGLNSVFFLTRNTREIRLEKGLRNAPATFKSVMDNVLKDIQRKICIKPKLKLSQNILFLQQEKKLHV